MEGNNSPRPGLCYKQHQQGTERKVLEQLATSDHKPVLIEIRVSKPRVESNTLPRWNYKKADWTKFSFLTNQYTAGINCKTIKTDKSAKAFTTAILRADKQSIPRGARKDYTPNWSEELQNLNEEVSKARLKVEEDPTDDNNINLKKAVAKLTVETNGAVRKSCHEKTDSLNSDKEGSKLWRLVKALNGDHDCQEASVALKQDCETLTGKDTANVLLKQYQSPGQLNFNQEKITAAEEEVQRALTTTEEKEPAHEVIRLPLTAQKLDTALSKLKSKSTSGPDKVSNDMLCKLGVQCQLEIGTHPKDVGKSNPDPHPQVWEAQKMPESCRPISLTSCPCKLMERILNHRLIWYLETNHLLIDEQAGFRKHRSTEDQVTYIS